MTARLTSLALSAVFLVAASTALPQSPTSGTISIGSGPHKGEYNFAPLETCFLATFDKKPPGLSVVMTSEKSSLSIDMPSIDQAHANQIQVVVVIADDKPGKGSSSVTYEIDTRPDAVLEPFQKAERANKGLSGKATTTLLLKGDSALLSFVGETATGIKLEGSVTCRKMN